MIVLVSCGISTTRGCCDMVADFDEGKSQNLLSGIALALHCTKAALNTQALENQSCIEQNAGALGT